MSEFWSSYELVKEIEKNDKGDVIRIAIARKNSKTYVDVRNYYTDKNNGELKPGKGISIPDDLADEIAEAILQSGSSQYDEEEE